MIVRIFRNADQAARRLAGEVARVLALKPTAVLGLPTGRTPVPLYREIVALARGGQLDLSRATTFNLDEFVGISPADPRSYHAFMHLHLFDHVNLPARRRHVLNGMAGDLARECARFERAIERAGGIDLQILGLGANGHIGFNEPAAALVAATHRTRLSAATRRANASLFGSPRRVPRDALSMGMATILHARRIVLVATGREKARCVRGMIDGPVTPHLPASFLQLHRRAEVWLDRDAAALIRP